MSIYLDYQASTPVDPGVLNAMQPYWETYFANPHSDHRAGWQAGAIIDVARNQVAGLIGAASEGCIFTSGATEANNLALKGAMQAAPAGRNRLVTVATEHSCVLESAHWLKRQGYELTVLPVDAGGLLSLDALGAALGDDVALVSVMAVNNEIGVIQPLQAIGARARAAGALFHTDAAQGFGKIPLDVEAMHIDLMSVSGHKIYGPKGIGALIVRPGVTLSPQMHGGGQEGDGLRSGTLAPALIAGLGKAAEISSGRMREDAEHAEKMWNIMTSLLPHPHRINGSVASRWHGNLNIAFADIDGARLIADLRRLSISSGAACASAKGRTSHVLEALGLSGPLAKASLRMGWGRFTTQADIEGAAAMINDAIEAQRRAAA
ncbi:cysteine desulfurase [Pacificimonas sp. WHA3]|uniref:Cysteine desulfurase n=1 Tax=Pacificimonas pallii TaxID=2827236 RepID=A0ABS6SES1_9SPHN|nr:cysteine desulfurase family protein [Pacificimonas pallii]MBV7256902.1 cysteine desulfurase [Pacificimonas pallii]